MKRREFKITTVKLMPCCASIFGHWSNAVTLTKVSEVLLSFVKAV